MRTYLQLGTNLGDRLAFLQRATEAIAEHCGSIEAASPIYETAAWGRTDQPDFLNQVIAVDTELSPQQLLETVLQIEKEHGRQRNDHWGSRTIDIDILYYEDRVIESPTLILPHPWLHRRRFVLVPLVDIAPDFIHPVLHRRNRELLAALPDEGDVWLYGRE